MRIYNVLGFAILAMQLLISAMLAPPWLGPYWGMADRLRVLVGVVVFRRRSISPT